MSKKKKTTETPKVTETKALLILASEAGEWERLKQEGILKETFSENNFRRDQSTEEIGVLDYKVTSDVIQIGEQQAHAIAFEDGFVYQVGKGFRKETVDGSNKEYILETFENLEEAEVDNTIGE